MTPASQPGAAANSASSAARTVSPASSSRFRSRIRRQHVRGIGALPPARLNQAQLLDPVQQPVEDHPLQVIFYQPLPEPGQHAGVEPLIV